MGWVCQSHRSRRPKAAETAATASGGIAGTATHGYDAMREPAMAVAVELTALTFRASTTPSPHSYRTSLLQATIVDSTRSEDRVELIAWQTSLSACSSSTDCANSRVRACTSSNRKFSVSAQLDRMQTVQATRSLIST